MVDNLFLKISDLKGSVTTKGFEGQIGLLSMSHGLNLNCFAGGGTEGRTSGVANHADISITKVMDQNSVKFNEHCCNATPFKEAIITVCRQKGDKIEKLLEYKFNEVLVSSYNVSCGGGNPIETLSLNYTKIAWTFVEQKSDGTKAGNVSASWNLQTNTPK
jgi:type VI secretion system secreted protein Hcp